MIGITGKLDKGPVKMFTQMLLLTVQVHLRRGPLRQQHLNG
jgi:hypothetical protein